MKFVDILYEKSDNIAWITINRPEVYNATRGRTTDEMSIALEDSELDDSIRVVVLSGTGPNAFCAGRDQSEDRLTSDYHGTATLDYTTVIKEMPKPVIAMVDGFCIGSGNILAYQCDFTVASTRSKFGQTGPRVGSPASGYGVGYLSEVVGNKKAKEIWMLSQQYTAEQAFNMGLVNSVVTADKLKDEVIRYCNLIKNNSPVILELEKITFNEISSYTEDLPSPTERYLSNYDESDEAEERRLAFIERRPINPDKNLPFLNVKRKQRLGEIE